MPIVARSTAALGALLAMSCSEPPPLALGESCAAHVECESGFCAAEGCAQPCTDASGCETGACAGVGPSMFYCLAECSSLTSLRDGFYCSGGVPRSCAEGGSSAPCRTCGCPTGQLCNALTQACEAPREVGEPCSSHAQCASNNCGHTAMDAAICFVAPGESCDGTNCGECVNLPDGGTECVQGCDDPTDCGGTEEDMLCWGRPTGEDQGFYCRAPCSEFDPSSCPDGYSCRVVRDRDFRSYARCFPDSLTIGSARHSCEDGGTADECGVCDDDPSNDCVQDCAGTWGGSATVDMCGTCDTDPSNDCVQDCEGAWGGSATVDPCGTCDSDPENDGNVDPCGACDTDPTNDCVPRCDFGEELLGGCWFVSNTGSDCNSTCYARGGTYSQQTRRVAGSSGSLDACRMIVEAWSPSVTGVTVASGQGGIGCAIQRAAVFGGPFYGRQHTDVVTTSAAYAEGYGRLCACEF